MPNEKIVAAEFCEEAIQKQQKSCINLGIYPAWPKTADRMLGRRDELTTAYLDIHQATDGISNAVDIFIDAIVCTVSVWNLEHLSEYRAAKKQLVAVNAHIAELAFDLSARLFEREDLQNKQPVSSNTHYHILEVMKGAAKGNHHYLGWIDEKLVGLRQQFDMKYWPSLADIVSELGDDAERAKIEVSDQTTQAALLGDRTSKADFFRAMQQRVANCIQDQEEGSYTKIGHLPKGFHLKDDTWATLVNILLDLQPDELVDGAYIKRVRQRTQELRHKK